MPYISISPRPLFSSSIDRVLNTSDESPSSASIDQSKSVADPSGISIQVEAPKTATVNSTVPSIEIIDAEEPSPPSSVEFPDTLERERGHIEKRSSTLTDTDSEYENDKTPLIHTYNNHHQQQNEQIGKVHLVHGEETTTNAQPHENENSHSFTPVTVQITMTSSGSPKDTADKEETTM